MFKNTILQNINWNIILVYLIVSILIIFATIQISFLNDLDLIQNFEKFGIDGLQQFDKNPKRIFYFLLWYHSSNFIGIILAFSISLFTIIKSKNHWINSMIILIILLLLNRLSLFENNFIKSIIFYPSQLFTNINIEYRFIINAIILITLSIIILLNKRIRNL